MILLAILFATVLILIVTVIGAVAIGGSLAIILFGDVIVCILVLVWVIKKLINKKRNKE